MGLAEIPEPPGDETDDADPGVSAHEVDHLRIDFSHAVHGGFKAAQVPHDGDRRHDEGEAHEGRLNRVGPAHGEEASEKDVEDRRGGADVERRLVGHVEGVLEEARARDDARGAVDRKEDQNDGRRADAKKILLVFEAVREVVGERERVVGLFRVDAKARRDDAPIDVGADDEADGDPRLANPHEKDGARQPHQQPAAHVGSPHREGRDEAVETAAAENVVAVVARVAVGEKPDAHHDDQIPYEGDRSRIREHRFCFLGD